MKIKRSFRGAVSLLAVVLVSIGIIVGTVGNLAHKSYLAALFAAVMLAFPVLVVRIRHSEFLTLFDQYNPVIVCFLLSFLCLALNGIWVIVFHPAQVPDYKTFLQAAEDLASGSQLSGKDYLAMFPHILGYSSFLSIFLRLFGKSIFTAAVINVFLTTGTGIVLYLLSLRWTKKKTAAALVFLLWIFCPSKMLYNTMTLSEPYYTFLLLLFLYMTSKALDRDCFWSAKQHEIEKTGRTRDCFRALIYGALCGIALALVNSARPIGVIPIIAFFLWVTVLTNPIRLRPQRRVAGTYLLILLVTYLLCGRIWTNYAAGKLEQEPPSIPGYSIYVGFNLETNGSYSDKDMDLLQNRYFGEYNRNAELTQRSMFDSAKERISANKDRIPGLMAQKLGTLLGHDEGGAFYSKESLSHKEYAFWCISSNCWYYFVWILSISGIYFIWKHNPADSYWLVPLCIIGIILAQLLVEVAARYHYCLIPMLLLLAAPSLGEKQSDALWT